MRVTLHHRICAFPWRGEARRRSSGSARRARHAKTLALSSDHRKSRRREIEPEAPGISWRGAADDEPEMSGSDHEIPASTSQRQREPSPTVWIGGSFGRERNSRSGGRVVIPAVCRRPPPAPGNRSRNRGAQSPGDEWSGHCSGRRQRHAGPHPSALASDVPAQRRRGLAPGGASSGGDAPGTIPHAANPASVMGSFGGAQRVGATASIRNARGGPVSSGPRVAKGRVGGRVRRVQRHRTEWVAGHRTHADRR